ncbi:MAG: sigma-70 family RNA polymerase sigma factor, partial [Candidatus Hydrogenedentes bacterium]|nr:sigma-70 family RNA polymerase sigma factor [Candidatus Hydrogenedentota bacterium]
MESDIELLQRWWTRRDAVAFNEIAIRYSGLVYAACLRVLGDASKAEDVAQECFMRLAERPAVVSISLSGWLHRVATRRALDVHRSDSRRRSREERYADTAEFTTSPEDLSWQEIRAFVDEAIDALPEEQRVVIAAHFLERRTHQALAAELGVSRGTVINRINKGIEQIRKHLATRGAAIAETALVAVLGCRLVEAAPAGLATELGRLALAGTAGKTAASATTPSIIGGGLVMKKALIGAVAVLIATLSVWFAMNRPTEPSNSGRVDSGAVKQEQMSATVPSTNSSVDTGQLASALGTALGSAQASTHAEKPVDEGAVVEGIVRNQSGAPVAGAAIHIAEQPTQDDVLSRPAVTHTGTDGRFRATHVNPEVYTVFADHPDYAPGWTGMKPSAAATEHVEIVLTQGGAIEGVVTSGGEPQAGAIVGAWLDASGQNSLTDAEGRYRIARVPTGEWVLGLILKDVDGV